MSHFKCNQCGKNIIEGVDGEYVTGCEHFPLPTTENVTVEPVTKISLDSVDNEFLLDLFEISLVGKRYPKKGK